jgi:hypothetical protein
MANNTNKNVLVYLILGVLVAALGVLLWILMKKEGANQSLRKDIAVKESTIKKTNSDLDSLNRVLTLKIEEVRKLGGDTIVLKEIQRQLQHDIIVVRAAGSKDGRHIAELNEKIKLYMAQLKEKDTEIERLLEERDRLNKANGTLRGQVSRSSDSLSKLDAERRDLAEKISTAMILRAEQIMLFAIDKKGREEENDSFKAKKVDQIGVEFTVGDNKVAKKENKDCMLRIVDPSGTAMSDPATGGGSLTVNGKQTVYSLKQAVLFDNNKPKVDFRWKPTAKLAPGSYIAEIYCEGYKIGEAPFEIR